MNQEWYEIRVAGQLSAGWSDWFDGLEVRALGEGATMLRGPLPDQAALHGVLARVYALNLTLLALRRVEPVAGWELGSADGVDAGPATRPGSAETPQGSR